MPEGHNGTLSGYFLDRRDEDGLPSANVKALFGGENKAFRLFRKGHVQKIQLVTQARKAFFLLSVSQKWRLDKLILSR